jgi:hypothetical protein
VLQDSAERVLLAETELREAIALSMLSETQSVFAGYSGGHLRDWPGMSH